MRYSMVFTAAGLVASVAGHGMVTKITGANGVEMPGLTVADGTPRDESSNASGAQADTAIIRDRDIDSGKATPLGRTQGNGKVDASVMIANFMSGAGAPTNNGTGVGVEDDIPDDIPMIKKRGNKWSPRQLLGGLLGGGGDSNAQDAEGTTVKYDAETSVKTSAGMGQTQGMPTVGDDGVINMTFRQINQDGAGPLEAMVDGTSAGTDMAAFQDAEMVQDVPGALLGLSTATTMEFPIQVQMPEGMTCDGSAGGADGVCVVRVRNNTPAGPFGGSAAFAQTPAARKRAIEYRMKKRAEESKMRRANRA